MRERAADLAPLLRRPERLLLRLRPEGMEEGVRAGAARRGAAGRARLGSRRRGAEARRAGCTSRPTEPSRHATHEIRRVPRRAGARSRAARTSTSRDRRFRRGTGIRSGSTSTPTPRSAGPLRRPHRQRLAHLRASPCGWSSTHFLARFGVVRLARPGLRQVAASGAARRPADAACRRSSRCAVRAPRPTLGILRWRWQLLNQVEHRGARPGSDQPVRPRCCGRLTT